MRKQTFTSAYAAGMVRPEDVLAFHRTTFGDAHMGPDDPPGDERNEGEQTQGEAEQASSNETVTSDESEPSFPAGVPLRDMTVEQREAYWKDKAKKHERTWRSVIDKNLTPEQVLAMQQELSDLRQANETDHEKALREAKDAGASEAREQVFTETATAMLRMALRGHGITKGDDLDEIVAATNLAHFKGEDGGIDDQKVAALAKRMAGTAGAQQWPDMGQDKSGSSKRTGGMAAGSEAWEELHGKKPNTNS